MTLTFELDLDSVNKKSTSKGQTDTHTHITPNQVLCQDH